jgi:hypothetical protein
LRFLAVIVKLNAPMAVGVPVYWPVVASSVSPGGREPAETLNVIGTVPEATIVTGALRVPTMPLASEAGAEMAGATARSSLSSWHAASASDNAKAAVQILNERMEFPWAWWRGSCRNSLLARVTCATRLPDARPGRCRDFSSPVNPARGNLRNRRSAN